MAQFRGTIQGQRGPASRLGSSKSGLSVSANGWTAGVKVLAETTKQGDFFTVCLTSGSHGDLPGNVLFSGTASEIRARLGER